MRGPGRPRRRTATPRTPLAERLEHVLREMEWKPADLGRACEVSEQSTVGNWLSGRNKTMDPVFAFRLQDKHRWNARWLLEGEPWPPRLPAMEMERQRILDGVGALPMERLKALASALGL
jgi:hypothetical protein